MKQTKYLIIGNSAAAVGTIEGIRQVDTEGSILLVSSEPYHTYSRPLISYLLLGKTDSDRMKYRPDDFYKNNSVECLFGQTASKIEAHDHIVTLSSGEEIKYEKLLIGTGSRPLVPELPGLKSVKNKFTFMSLDDAKALDAAITPKSRVLILGAGLIGLKCAEGIHRKAAEVTVVGRTNRILRSIIDEDASDMIKAHIESKGIKFHLSDNVESLTSNKAKFKSGDVIEFDILVTALGVQPNVELVKAAGCAVVKGIRTNERCETTLCDIYAAGDCSESHDITTDTDKVIALLPNAYMQGETAGINMAGGTASYDKAMPMNAIGFFGLHLVTAGSYDGEAYVEKTDSTYKKLVYADNTLKGFIMVGNIERAGIYTSLIREKTPLSEIDFELIKEKPQLMAFSKKERSRKLGGRK